MRNADRDPRPVGHSIMTAYRPVEDYWRTHGPSSAMGPDPSSALAPLDASLVRMALGFLPDPPVLIDAATDSTGGASAVLGLSHPRVLRVISSATDGPASEALRAYAADRPPADRPVPLEFVARESLGEYADGRSPRAILADARGGSVEALAGEIGRWLDAGPTSLVFVLGLGRVGECPAIDALVRLCDPGSGRRLRLLRDQADVLAASGLGMVDRDGGPAEAILRRVAAQFSGNLDILEMLKTINQAALRASRVDDGVMTSYPFAWVARDRFDRAEWELSQARASLESARSEVAQAQAQAAHLGAALTDYKAWSDEALKVTREAGEAACQPLLYEIWSARQRAEAAEGAAASAQADRDRLRAELDEARERVARWQAHAAHPLIKIRRRLSAGRTGVAWRAVRSRLNRPR